MRTNGDEKVCTKIYYALMETNVLMGTNGYGRVCQKFLSFFAIFRKKVLTNDDDDVII